MVCISNSKRDCRTTGVSLKGASCNLYIKNSISDFRISNCLMDFYLDFLVYVPATCKKMKEIKGKIKN